MVKGNFVKEGKRNSWGPNGRSGDALISSLTINVFTFQAWYIVAHVASGYTRDLGWAGSGNERECRLIKSKEGNWTSGAAVGELYLSRMPRQKGKRSS